MKNQNLLILAFSILIVGCATAPNTMGGGFGAEYTPVIDGVQNTKFNIDLTECRNLARQAQGAQESQILTQAVAGALAGAAAGAIISGNQYGLTGYGARAGAVSGTAQGAGGAVSMGKRIIINCMIGRGHKVLG
jgi:hypothetical protein